MTNTILDTPAPRKGGRWLRKLLWLAVILIVLLVVTYFVATSSAVFKSVILPRVSKMLNAEITVTDASISPFSQIVLQNLKVQTTGAEPLLTAPEVRVRYSLMDILGGNIHVDEVALSSPTIVLVENPDNSTNLDPIKKSSQSTPAEKPAQPSKPAQIDLRKLTLIEATVRKVKVYKNGNRDVAELSHLGITLEDLKNGQSGKLGLNADVKVENNPPAPGVSGFLAAKLNGSFSFTLTGDLKPGSIKGNTHLDVSRAEGALAELSALGADLDCEVTPSDINQLALRFQKGGTRLGELRVSGPFDIKKTEGRLSVAVLSIDKQLLNLAGAKTGIGFGSTTLNSTNEILLAKSGSLITAVGQLNVSKFEVTRANETTPPLDFQAQYDVTVDLAQSNSLVRGLTLVGTQRGNPLLHAQLTSPMPISWGNVANGVGDSAFNLAVTGFNLADWKTFLGSLAPAGTVNAQAKVLSQQGGQQLTFDLNSQVDNLTVAFGSNQITQASVSLQANGKAAGLKQFNLSQYSLSVSLRNQPMLSVSGSGTYDLATTNADMQVKVQTALPQLLEVMPQPDANVSSGTVEFKGRVTQNQTSQSITGNLALADFTGRFGKNEFRSFGVALGLDVGRTPQQIQIRKVSGKLTEGANAGGSFDLAGTLDPATKATQLTATLAGFNQNGLRPFLEPLLTDKTLVSVAINAKASAQYDPQGASALKADVQVANLLVKDTKNSFPATPLEAKLQVDASILKQVADVRQFQITLTPTSRAKNELQLSGQVDMSQTNAIQGKLKLAADSLDVTSYYDLFAGEKKPSESSSGRSGTKPASTPTASEKEPAATILPFRNFTTEANLRRFYLREVEVADFQTTLKIDGGHVVLNPFKFTLNGAPADITLDMDLSMPGYKYDLAFNAQRAPLAPLINSFQPERKDQIGGSVTAKLQASGAGVTGASLQKNLAGQFDVSCTNLNLSVVDLKNPMLKTLVNVVSRIPELLRNPVSVAASLLQGLAGKPGSTGGLADELQKSPIDAILARGTISSGRVNLQQATVQSAAFKSDAQGTITLAAVMTNSALQIPVSISLSLPRAQQMNLVPANTPTNAAYAKLPDFLTIKGTIGNPKADINKLVLAGAALKGIGGTNSNTGGTLQQVSDLLTGLTPGATNAPANTQTNQGGSKTGSLLQSLGGILRDSTAPANSQTNQPATNQSPVNDLINGLFGPKKK